MLSFAAAVSHCAKHAVFCSSCVHLHHVADKHQQRVRNGLCRPAFQKLAPASASRPNPASPAGCRLQLFGSRTGQMRRALVESVQLVLGKLPSYGLQKNGGSGRHVVRPRPAAVGCHARVRNPTPAYVSSLSWVCPTRSTHSKERPIMARLLKARLLGQHLVPPQLVLAGLRQHPQRLHLQVLRLQG